MRDDVEQAIKKFEIKTFGNRKNIEFAEGMLNDDETVLFVSGTNLTISYNASGGAGFFPGVLFLTDKRVFFNYRALGNFSSDSISLDEIRSVNYYGNGLAGSHIQLHGLIKSYDFLVTYKRNITQLIAQEFETAIDNYRSQQAALNSNPQPNAPQPDIADQIEKLAQLRDKGIITEEEFQAKKTDLLSRM
ncbi:MAG: SHOCT domain-containing protein [Oscillospiraceae bacterium]|nr:SHOCT domain-containing protein [Oscillospiraceae bacterium]